VLHRHVTLVCTQKGRTLPSGIVERVNQRLPGWTRVLHSNLASTWVFKAPPSALSHRALERDGYVIGLDFNPAAGRLETLLSQTWGAYVAIEIDPARRAVTVLRDPTGRIECWRLRLGEVDVLFSHYDDVYWLQKQQSAVDWDYIGHHLNQDFLHGEATGLAEISELLPGAALRYVDGQASSEMRWWPDKIAAAPLPDIETAATTLRERAQTAVTFWADRYQRIGLDLSGGLDSSIVLGLLKHQNPDRVVIACNKRFQGAGGDERSFAQAAAAMHGVPMIEREPIASDIELAASFSRKLMRPRTRLIAMGGDEAGIEFARNSNTDAFFTGTGGDHLFYAHLPVTAASDYIHHGGSLSGFLAAALDIARLSRNTVWTVLGETLRERLKRKTELCNLTNTQNGFLSSDARAAADFDRYTHPWAIAAAATTPPAKLNQIVWITELQRHYRRYGRAAVVEEVHPFFSQPLMEACLATPAYWFGVDGLPRGLARRAFADLLPPSIRARRSKGASTTYLLDYFGRCLPRLRELLLDGYLAQRGLLDRAAVEKALTPLAIAAAKDFQALFICLPTELWIQQAESDRASAEAAAPAMA
jgi:asparagine synthase (glutamine-hydrolysing)